MIHKNENPVLFTSLFSLEFCDKGETYQRKEGFIWSLLTSLPSPAHTELYQLLSASSYVLHMR